MADIDGLAERIEAGRLAKGWSKAELCVAAGIRAQRYATVLARGGPRYLQRVARALGVRVEWLTTGAHPPPWYRPGLGLRSAREQARAAAAYREADGGDAGDDAGSDGLAAVHIPFLGGVTAGAGWTEASSGPADWRPLRIPAHWRAVRIHGDSGYPVVWDGQTVLVDDRLPLRHNRLVVVQTEDRRAYLKRYCVCTAVPAGFVLASVNVGMDSFAVDPERPVKLAVVVGVLFTDALTI